MNHSISYLSGPVTDALGWTLLHAMWQGFALVLPVALGLHLLRNGSSALRYRLGVLALLAQVLASIATFFWYYDPVVALANPVQTTYPLQTLHVRWQTVTEALPWRDQVQQFLEAHLNQFVLMYLIGVAVFAIRLAGGWLYLQRLSQTAVQPASEQLTTLTHSIRSIMQIKAVVRVYESGQITVPLVVGVLKPVLLLPVSVVTTLSIREVEAVLAHELAHIKRHDYAVNLLQSVVEVLYFFHPALWWLSARVREEREHCCDDLAVQTIGGDGRTLAQALAHVEELRLARTATPQLAMAFANKRQQLLHRVRRMLGVPTRPLVSNGSLAGLTLAALLLVSASVYAIQQDNQPKPKLRAGKLQSTRRHKVADGTEFTMTDNRKISNVVWKGQKLPATQVARLQRQLDQVMTGQISLDDMKQPDRDILLTILETNQSFKVGMEGLSEGLAQLDYNNIILSSLDAAKDAVVTPANVTTELKGIAGHEAAFMADTSRQRAIHKQLDSLVARMNVMMAERKDALDKVSKEMATLATQRQGFEKQSAPFRELQRQQAGKMAQLAKQQAQLSAELAKLSKQNDAKAKARQRQLEAEQERLERQIEQQSEKLEKAAEQLEPLSEKFEPAQERMAALADSISRLYEPIGAISEQIGALSEEISEEAMRQAGEAMRSLDQLSPVAPVTPPARPAVPSRAPRPARPARPATPAPVARPDKVHGALAPVAPAQPPTPRPAPKPVVPPTPPKPDNE